MTETTLVTGASSGIGAEVARQLAARGHDLGLAARRTDRLEQLVAELTALRPGRYETCAMDVTDDEQVFRGFAALEESLGGLDRVVVNAGIGAGAPLGTGRYEKNKATALTNFVGALAQIEAAMEVFREAGRGHLVVISSVSAVRGLPRAQTTYAATKAGVAHLAEGLRAELLGSDIDVTVVYPGYIASEMTQGLRTPLLTSTEKGAAAIVDAIVRRKRSAFVPALPWVPLSAALKHLPLPVARRLMG